MELWWVRQKRGKLKSTQQWPIYKKVWKEHVSWGVVNERCWSEKYETEMTLNKTFFRKLREFFEFFRILRTIGLTKKAPCTRWTPQDRAHFRWGGLVASCTLSSQLMGTKPLFSGENRDRKPWTWKWRTGPHSDQACLMRPLCGTRIGQWWRGSHFDQAWL